MDIRDTLRAYQHEKLAERKAEQEKNQQKMDEYLQSEQYQKDIWEHQQDLWEKKAKKEGWHYTRQPFISALEKQQQEQLIKQQQIAFLKEKLKELEEGE